ncbi:hypothetical protein [Aeromonas sp.]|uniref:hypothetical protein n=1 Tax=Aeromonas sp. TaxID=647 RepID=UPI00258E8B36|nr:hypothetical protein [Aeromonas sp.]MCX7128072.1 hypothetical protein [Aeromonas sp.]
MPEQQPNNIKALNVYQLDGLVALIANKILLIKQDGYEIDVVDMLTDEQQPVEVVQDLLIHLMTQE